MLNKFINYWCNRTRNAKVFSLICICIFCLTIMTLIITYTNISSIIMVIFLSFLAIINGLVLGFCGRDLWVRYCDAKEDYDDI